MLYELEENEELKKRLIELSEKDIKRYFSYSEWGYYSNDLKKRKK